MSVIERKTKETDIKADLSVYGSSKAFGLYRKDIPETENINTNVISSAKDAHPKRVNIVNCVPDNLQIEPGQCTNDGAKAAIIALEKAVEEIKAGHLDAIIHRCPVNMALPCPAAV